MPYCSVPSILKGTPDLLDITFNAMIKEKTICGPASLMLKMIWGRLSIDADEKTSKKPRCETIKNLDTKTSTRLLSEVSSALVNPNSHLRDIMNRYILPGILSEFPKALNALLSSLLSSRSTQHTVR